MIYDVIILGSGPAGYTAAIYSSRAYLKTLLLSGNLKGGQLTETTLVENYPGFVDGIMGPELMQKMEAQAKRFGTEIVAEEAASADFSKKPFVVNDKYQAKTVIIATGASHKKLGLPEEEEYRGKGLSYCATCDAFFFRGKDIAVIGGGDTAMEEASFIAKFAKKVYLIHRRHEFRASRIMVERVLKNPKIEVIWDRTVKKLNGRGKLQAVILESTSGEKDMELPVEGLFVAIGLKPNTDFLQGKVELDEKGYVKKFPISNSKFPSNNMTSVDGVFVAGDVADPVYRQAVTAAGDGCAAALEVEKWLTEK